MQIYEFIIFLAVIARHKAFIFQWIACHHTCYDSFFKFVVKHGYRFYAEFLTAIFRTPYGQRSAPVAATRKIPVLKILKPFSKTSGTGRSRFPLYGVVEFHHALAGSGSADKPAVERIIDYRSIRAPAVGIVVGMLLHAEQFA